MVDLEAVSWHRCQPERTLPYQPRMTKPQRTVLITGASSGIGKATAQRLLLQGWKVIAAARKTEAMNDLRELGAEC